MSNNKLLNLSDFLTKPDIRTLGLYDLQDYLKSHNQPAFRSKQVWEWLHKKFVHSFDDMTTLPASLRTQLAEDFSIPFPQEELKQTSIDGSRKYLLKLADHTTVECVGMPHNNKLAACISTQAGCGMACAFCATGAAGLSRSLTAQEMVDQVLFIKNDFEMPVTSVVFMGQGEPFANYTETLKALRTLNSPDGLNIGARHLTVSTCGVIPSITKFAKEPEQFTLAVSLHSAVQSTRNELMPGVKRWSLNHLWETMKLYTAKTNRRPTYEYAMIAGINDTESELQALCDFCRDTLCHVNLIALNDIPGSKFKPSPHARLKDFVKKLNSYGIEATIRNSRGADIDAACGQLKQLARSQGRIIK